jgi:hypothetical protein
MHKFLKVSPFNSAEVGTSSSEIDWPVCADAANLLDTSEKHGFQSQMIVPEPGRKAKFRAMFAPNGSRFPRKTGTHFLRLPVFEPQMLFQNRSAITASKLRSLRVVTLIPMAHFVRAIQGAKPTRSRRLYVDPRSGHHTP